MESRISTTQHHPSQHTQKLCTQIVIYVLQFEHDLVIYVLRLYSARIYELSVLFLPIEQSIHISWWWFINEPEQYRIEHMDKAGNRTQLTNNVADQQHS